LAAVRRVDPAHSAPSSPPWLWEDRRSSTAPEGPAMLTPPTWPILIISLLLAIAAVVSVFVPIPLLSANAVWALLAGYATLMLGVFSKTL
jgi:hypothetical protein